MKNIDVSPFESTNYASAAHPKGQATSFRFYSNLANDSKAKDSLTTLFKPVIALVFCACSVQVHAAILSDSSEQRIQVRNGGSDDSQNNRVYISPATGSVTSNKTNNSLSKTNDSLGAFIKSNNNAGVTMLSESGWSNRSSLSESDRMQGLIVQKENEFQFDAKLSIEESKRVQLNSTPNKYRTTYGTGYNDSYSGANNNFSDYTSMDFNVWLNSNRYRASQVANFQNYLGSRIGVRNVPPMSQLLTTARSWSTCGYEPYQLPPQELWSNMVPTLRLYTELKNQGVLPASAEIRSVYRSPALNSCAGGASSSKHMTANAMDIWVPDYDDNPWRLSSMQDSLCQFWQYQGESYNFGLGLYSTGAIHLDTDGHRKWGFNHTSSSSSCRY